MARLWIGAAALGALLSLGACTDPDSVSGSGFERGIDADIAATHDAGAPTSRNLGPRGSENWRLGGGMPVGR